MPIALPPSAVQKPGSSGVKWVSAHHLPARSSLRSPDQSGAGRGWGAGILLSKRSQCLGRGHLLRAQMPVQLPRMLASWTSSACLWIAGPVPTGVLILFSAFISFALVSRSFSLAQEGKLSKRMSASKTCFALLPAMTGLLPTLLSS